MGRDIVYYCNVIYLNKTNAKANDIIYVDPVIKITTSLLQEITPIVGLITNVLIIIALFGQ